AGGIVLGIGGRAFIRLGTLGFLRPGFLGSCRLFWLGLILRLGFLLLVSGNRPFILVLETLGLGFLPVLLGLGQRRLLRIRLVPLDDHVTNHRIIETKGVFDFVAHFLRALHVQERVVRL